MQNKLAKPNGKINRKQIKITIFMNFKIGIQWKWMPNYLLLEPLHGIIFGHSVFETNPAFTLAAMWDSETRTSQHDVEIHAINPYTWIILDTKIDVFLDTKPKVACGGKVFFPQLIFLDLDEESFLILTHCSYILTAIWNYMSWRISQDYLQALLENFLSFWSTNCTMTGNLFIPSNAKWAHRITCYKNTNYNWKMSLFLLIVKLIYILHLLRRLGPVQLAAPTPSRLVLACHHFRQHKCSGTAFGFLVPSLDFAFLPFSCHPAN